MGLKIPFLKRKNTRAAQPYGSMVDGVPLNFSTWLNSDSSALKLSAVWSCIRLLSEVPASLPIMVYKENPDGTKEPAKNHPVYKLLHRPNNFMNPSVFTEVIFSHKQSKGNGLALIVRNPNTGRIMQLLPIKWADCEVKMYNGELWYKVKSQLYSIDALVPADDVFHIKLFSGDGITGRNPIAHARATIDGGHGAQNFETEFWKRGGNHKYVVEGKGNFPTGDAWNEWLDKFMGKNTGEGNNHSYMFLDQDKSLKKLDLSVPDAAFVSLKTFSVQDVCRWFQVPPNMVFELTKANYNSLEQQNRSWVQNRLRVDVKHFEEEAERKLFTPAEQGKYHVKIILDGLLRGSALETAQLAQIYVQSGVISRDDARVDFLNKAPLGGDMAVPLTPAFLVGKQETTPPATNTNNENSNNDGDN